MKNKILHCQIRSKIIEKEDSYKNVCISPVTLLQYSRNLKRGLNSDGHVESETEEAHRRGCDEILLTSMKYEKRS